MTNKNRINIQNEDEISLKEVVFKLKTWTRYLVSKWLFFLLFGFLGGGLGYFYAFSKMPIFSGTTTFVLESNEGGGGLASMPALPPWLELTLVVVVGAFSREITYLNFISLEP